MLVIHHFSLSTISLSNTLIWTMLGWFKQLSYISNNWQNFFFEFWLFKFHLFRSLIFTLMVHYFLTPSIWGSYTFIKTALWWSSVNHRKKWFFEIQLKFQSMEFLVCFISHFFALMINNYFISNNAASNTRIRTIIGWFIQLS
jgi:hypothetical protein